MLQLFCMIKSEDGIKCRGDFFWSVVDFSFEKDTIGHIFTGQYYGLHKHSFYKIFVKLETVKKCSNKKKSCKFTAITSDSYVVMSSAFKFSSNWFQKMKFVCINSKIVSNSLKI